ncbi:prolyl aminopeptidase [Actinokineospora diospyrosa]|uniref:Proline iminopeptidase n=1 Tax=Actinokineospora diospyrosa TaxID=103728 RepID=A0ABT1ILR9_9PSEU|nr:prolyl aminopeptidase [Actinokineospora diospyrosa]MCP2273599.1 proline iminopeptidase [Actinokineospora diospyrosa]
MLYTHGEPRAHGLLDVGHGHLVHWEESGDPGGKPALIVHGGPGSGLNPASRDYFDPARYRIVQFDQRGCGRSTPNAGAHTTDLTHNTTHHLVADMEALREHLGIDRWLLSGGSWGSTLILTYAQRHPDRVTEIVLSAATTSRYADFEWITSGVGAFFPEALERFRAGASHADDVIAAYHDLVSSSDAAVRERAARDWTAWEDTVVSLEPAGYTKPYSDRPTEALYTLVRLVTHYWSNKAWLEDGQLLRDANRLTGIPGTILHGRHDIGGPVEVAWTLAEAWPDAELVVVEDAGHTGSAELDRLKREALDRYAVDSPGTTSPVR